MPLPSTTDPTHVPDASVPLLVSVSSADEALRISNFPLAIVDFKNPLAGALGRCHDETLRQAIDIPAPALGFSAACGELQQTTNGVPPALPAGFKFAKAGPHGYNNTRQLAGAMQRFRDALPTQTQAVAVAYADHRLSQTLAAESIAQLAITLEYQWLLIDTFTKDGRGLLDWITEDQLSALISRCHEHQLHVVLAGSIKLPHASRLLATGADLLGVRGAVCTGSRASSIDREKVRQWCDHLSQHALNLQQPT